MRGCMSAERGWERSRQIERQVVRQDAERESEERHTSGRADREKNRDQDRETGEKIARGISAETERMGWGEGGLTVHESGSKWLATCAVHRTSPRNCNTAQCCYISNGTRPYHKGV